MLRNDEWRAVLSWGWDKFHNFHIIKHSVYYNTRPTIISPLNNLRRFFFIISKTAMRKAFNNILWYSLRRRKTAEATNGRNIQRFCESINHCGYWMSYLLGYSIRLSTRCDIPSWKLIAPKIKWYLVYMAIYKILIHTFYWFVIY